MKGAAPKGAFPPGYIRNPNAVAASQGSWPAPVATEGGARTFMEGFQPRKMCQFYAQGRCNKAEACTFAHAVEELAPDSPEAQLYMQQSSKEELQALAQAELDEALLAAAALSNGEKAEGEAGAEEVFDFPTEEGSPSLYGPREFAQAPKRLCAMWLQHPTMCLKGDSCTLGHGLMELNMGGEALFIKVDGGDAPGCEVKSAQVAWQASGKGAASSYGPMSGGAGPQQAARAALLRAGGQAGSVGPYGAGKDGFGGKGAAGKQGAAAMALADAGSAPWVGGAQMPPGRFVGAQSGFKPRRLCNYWIQDPALCQKGAECTFAHGVLELHPDSVEGCGVSRFHNTGLSPTKMCIHFEQGACKRGLSCTFAHSEEELVERQVGPGKGAPGKGAPGKGTGGKSAQAALEAYLQGVC